MPTVRAELSAITPHPALFYIKTRCEWQLAAARSGGTALARARVASAERREANSLSQRASCSRFFLMSARKDDGPPPPGGVGGAADFFLFSSRFFLSREQGCAKKSLGDPMPKVSPWPKSS